MQSFVNGKINNKNVDIGINLLYNHHKKKSKGNLSRFIKKKVHNNEIFYKNKISNEDDNKEIMSLIISRLKLSKKRYSHGVIIGDNTEKYGTNSNDWELMALEELLDGLIYLSAALIRKRREIREIKKYDDTVTNDDIICDYRKI